MRVKEYLLLASLVCLSKMLCHCLQWSADDDLGPPLHFLPLHMHHGRFHLLFITYKLVITGNSDQQTRPQANTKQKTDII